MENKKKNPVATIILAIISILWMYPIVLILINSLKKESAITDFRCVQYSKQGNLEWPVKLCCQCDTDGFPEILLVQPYYFCNVSSFDPSVLFHVRMVYCSCKRKTFQTFLLPVCVQYGSSFPDGNVHSGKDSRYTETEQSVQYLHYLSGIWSRTGSVYVYRLCKRNSAGDRGGGSD